MTQRQMKLCQGIRIPSNRVGQGTTTLLVQKFHKAKKMTSDPTIKAQKKKKKQEPDLLQHKRETNFAEKLDQQRGTVLNS
jgi:hypothetical protein